jgi:hypothetical protein
LIQEVVQQRNACIGREPSPEDVNTFSDLLARTLSRESFSEWLPNGPKEGPTRWIIAKYPFACSKCGQQQCHCLLDPEALENRREDPESYEENFKRKAEAARMALRGLNFPLFTLQSMMDHFHKIYRANYHHQDYWEIGMHLSEEVGEATIELSRLELRVRAPEDLNQANLLEKAFVTVRRKLDKQVEKIKTGDDAKRKKHTDIEKALAERQRSLQADLWGTYEEMVGEKLKEEIADVLSWFAAIIIKIDRGFVMFRDQPKRFDKKDIGDALFLGCPWCHQPTCGDECLVSHAISSEIFEYVSKF